MSCRIYWRAGASQPSRPTGMLMHTVMFYIILNKRKRYISLGFIPRPLKHGYSYTFGYLRFYGCGAHASTVVPRPFLLHRKRPGNEASFSYIIGGFDWSEQSPFRNAGPVELEH